MQTDTLADLGKMVFHKLRGSPRVLVQDRKGLALAAALDTAAGVLHKEGHCDGTVVYSTEDPGALGMAWASD